MYTIHTLKGLQIFKV